MILNARPLKSEPPSNDGLEFLGKSDVGRGSWSCVFPRTILHDCVPKLGFCSNPHPNDHANRQLPKPSLSEQRKMG